MTDSFEQYAGRYKLSYVKIANNDITNMVNEINVFSSIMDTTNVIKIIVNDGRGLLTSVPFMGGQDVEISLDFNGDGQKYKMKVAKIRDIKSLETSRLYVVECISQFAFESQYKKISKAYSGLVTDVANSIWEEYGGGEKIGIFHPSDNKQSVIIPNWSPQKTMTWLAKRAKYSQTNTRFKFYQDSKGKYNFLPLELFNEIYSKPSIEYTIRKDVRRQDNIGGDTPNTSSDMTSVLSMYHGDSMDIINAIRQGVISSKNVNINVYDKSLSQQEYNYFSDANSSYYNKGKFYDEDNYGPGRLRFNVDGNYPDNALIEVSQMKNSQIFPHSGMVTIVVMGNQSLDLGQNIRLKVPKVDPAEQDKPDEIYDGVYMIVGKRDKYDKDKIVSSLDLIKDGL